MAWMPYRYSPHISESKWAAVYRYRDTPTLPSPTLIAKGEGEQIRQTGGGLRLGNLADSHNVRVDLGRIL